MVLKLKRGNDRRIIGSCRDPHGSGPATLLYERHATDECVVCSKPIMSHI